MGGSASIAATHNAPVQTPVPAGKIRICMAGFNISIWAGRAHRIASYLAKTYPDKFETWHYWDKDPSWIKQHTAKADGTPFEDPVQALTAEEVARSSSDVLYFKEDPELSKMWTGSSLFEASHIKKFGLQTASASGPSKATFV